jgi:hypothetical protein
MVNFQRGELVAATPWRAENRQRGAGPRDLPDIISAAAIAGC